MRKLIVFAVLGLLASSCAASPDPILVGAIYPAAGSQGPGGTEEYRGVQLAVEFVNARGGVHGRPIRIQLEETETGEAAPGAVDRLADAGAQVIVGSYGSTISRPAAATASRRGVVFWETGAVGELGMSAATGRYVFRFPASGGVLGNEAVNFIADQIAPALGHSGPIRFAVAYVDDVYGRSVGTGAIEEIQRAGTPLVADLPYDLATVDMDALVQEVAASQADVLVVSAYLSDGVALRQALVRHDVPLLASIGTSSSYCMREFGALLGDDAVGLFASDKPSGEAMDTDKLDPEAAEALEWAREEYRQRHDDIMTAPALTGFAGAWALFRHVLPESSDLSADAVAEAALRVRIPDGGLPNGSGLQFAPPGHADAGANLRASSVIWQWVAPDTREIVWPPHFATHPIVTQVL